MTEQEHAEKIKDTVASLNILIRQAAERKLKTTVDIEFVPEHRFMHETDVPEYSVITVNVYKPL